MRLDRGDDRPGDFVLDGKDVFEVAIVTLGPDVFVVDGVDQLCGDAHPVAGAPHAALDHVAHAESFADLLYGQRFLLERKRRVAGNYENRAKLR